MDKPRKEYRETHYEKNVALFPLTEMAKVTEIEHPETHEKATGCGWTRDEANRDAERRPREKDDSYSGI